MAYRVVWSQRALQDLEAIAHYIEQDSSAYATAVVRSIVNQTKTLNHFPRAGLMFPQFDDEKIRELLAFSYRFIYQVSENQVLIAAVIHGRRILP